MVQRMNRGALSPLSRRRPRVRWTLRGANGLLLVVLVIVGLGPLLWLAKSAISTTQDTLRYPMRLWPSGFDFENLVTAWRDAQIGHYFLNTVKIAVGSWLVQLVVAVTGGFVLGVLR